MGKSRTNPLYAKAPGKPKRDRDQKLTRRKNRVRRRRKKQEGAVGRFSDSQAVGYYLPEVKPRKGGRITSHSVAVVHRTLRLAYEIGNMKAAEVSGISRRTVECWKQRRFLPKTGKYTFDKMIALITRARRIYFLTRDRPLSALQEATSQTPEMTWGQVKMYLYFQAMPTLPGFPLYADRMANQKAEDYGRGLRNYSAVLGIEPPHIPPVKELPRSRTSQTGQRVVPPQKGRKFLVESQVTSLIPRREHGLL